MKKKKTTETTVIGSKHENTNSGQFDQNWLVWPNLDNGLAKVGHSLRPDPGTQAGRLPPAVLLGGQPNPEGHRACVASDNTQDFRTVPRNAFPVCARQRHLAQSVQQCHTQFLPGLLHDWSFGTLVLPTRPRRGVCTSGTDTSGTLWPSARQPPRFSRSIRTPQFAW